MKKRICIITSSFPRCRNDSSDASVFIRDFALSLADENYDIFVLTPLKKDSKNDYEKIKVHFFPWLEGDFGFGLSSLNPKNPFDFFKLASIMISGLFSTVKFIKKNEIDFCLAMWAVPSGFFALAAKILFKTPYSVLALGSDIYRIKDYPFGRFILKKVLKNAQKLFADGLQLAQDVQQISNRECNFLASGRILDTSLHKIDYAKFDSTKINFTFLGRYHSSKGIDLLLEAIGLLSYEEKKQSLFHIFGGGPLEEKIKQMIKELDLGANTFVNDYIDGDKVFSYMSKSNYVIIPSRSDSLSMVLFEAIQSNKPVILTNIGDSASLVTQYNVGFVVEPNAKSIADGIRQAIKSDQTQLDSFTSGMNDLKNYLERARKKSVQTFIESL